MASDSEKSIVISALRAALDTAVASKVPGQLDVFLELELSGTSVQTKTVQNCGLEPRWDPTDGWRLHDLGGSPFLIARAFNRNPLARDTLLGEGKIALEELLLAQTTAKQMALRDGGDRRIGSFLFEVREYHEDAVDDEQDQVPAAGKGPARPNGVGPYQEAVLSGPDIAQPQTPPQTTTSFPQPPSDAEAIAAKRELVPADELSATARRVAPDQANGRELETVAAPDNGGSAAGANDSAAPPPPPLPDYLPVDGAATREVGRDARPLADQVAQAAEQIAPAQQHGREIATVAGDGWETTSAADLLAAQPQQPPAAADAIAMKRDAAPATEVAAAAERIAPDQAHAPKIETVATDPVDRPRRVEEALSSAPSDASDIKGYTPLDTSEDHWAAAQAATDKAREQARILERAAIESTKLARATAKSQHDAEQARRQQMETEERLSALDLESKRHAVAKAQQALEAEEERLNRLTADAEEAQARAADLNTQVQQKGDKLHTATKDAETRRRRLEELLADLAAANAAAAEAESAHREHVAALEPLRRRHRRSTTVAQKLEADLAVIQRKRAELEALEAQYAKDLDEARAVQEVDASQIAALEPVVQRDLEKVQGTRGQLEVLQETHGSEATAAAEQKAALDRMNEETQALIEAARREQAAAQQRHQALMEAHNAAVAHKQALMDRQGSLAAAETELSELQSQLSALGAAVADAETRAAKLERELLASQHRIDEAQACKEELWHLAKMHGEAADKATDAHFMRAARAHQALLGRVASKPEKPPNGSFAVEQLANEQSFGRLHRTSQGATVDQTNLSAVADFGRCCT